MEAKWNNKMLKKLFENVEGTGNVSVKKEKNRNDNIKKKVWKKKKRTIQRLHIQKKKKKIWVLKTNKVY